MNTETYSVRLNNGQWVGNLISGPMGKHFVAVTEKDKVRFYSEAYARRFAREYVARDFSVIKNDK